MSSPSANTATSTNNPADNPASDTLSLTPAQKDWHDLLTECGKQHIFQDIKHKITDTPAVAASTFVSIVERKEYLAAFGISILHMKPILDALSKLTPAPPPSLPGGSGGSGAAVGSAALATQTVVTELSESVIQSFVDAVRGVLKEDELNETALSKMSLTKANRIFDLVGLIPTEEQVDDEIPQAEFTPFKWHYETEDDDMSKAICKHLKSQLEKIKLTGRDKFDIHDVHNDKEMFSVQIGSYLLAGGVDAVIVPFKVPSYMCAKALRVVIDWKAPPYVAFEDVHAQAFGKLVAAAVSQHPVLAVVTDLATKAHLFQVTGSTVKIYRDLSPQRGFDYIVAYLKACSKVIEFDMATGELQNLPGIDIHNSIHGAKKIKEHFAVHPLKTQLDSVMDFDAPSWERYDTALQIMKPWLC